MVVGMVLAIEALGKKQSHGSGNTAHAQRGVLKPLPISMDLLYSYR
jgi:hypothetical protein